mmetsp:Transcript_17047/g.46876  ORF Transcript_17047/g.46876 Transcript_17047/m.46876 type:complete len:230 (+) Transcript_17047:364-1053(+)
MPACKRKSHFGKRSLPLEWRAIRLLILLVLPGTRTTPASKRSCSAKRSPRLEWQPFPTRTTKPNTKPNTILLPLSPLVRRTRTTQTRPRGESRSGKRNRPPESWMPRMPPASLPLPPPGGSSSRNRIRPPRVWALPTTATASPDESPSGEESPPRPGCPTKLPRATTRTRTPMAPTPKTDRAAERNQQRLPRGLSAAVAARNRYWHPCAVATNPSAFGAASPSTEERTP